MNLTVTIPQVMYYLNPDKSLVTIDEYYFLSLDLKKLCKPIWNYADIR